MTPQELLDRFILAAKATSRKYERCDPKLPQVLTSLAYHLEFPDRATAYLVEMEAIERRHKK